MHKSVDEPAQKTGYYRLSIDYKLIFEDDILPNNGFHGFSFPNLIKVRLNSTLIIILFVMFSAGFTT